MFRLPETFALTPNHLRDFRLLPPHPTYVSPPSVLRITPSRAGETRARATQEHASKAAGACRLFTPPRSITPPIPTHLFHVKHARTIPAHNQEREDSTCARAARLSAALRAGLRRARCARPPAPPAPIEADGNAGCVSPRRRTGFSTHRFHVKPMSTDHPRPVLLSCPRSERSLSVHSPRLPPSPPTQNETQNTLPDRPIPLTHTHPRSTFIPVRRNRQQPKGTTKAPPPTTARTERFDSAHGRDDNCIARLSRPHGRRGRDDPPRT